MSKKKVLVFGVFDGFHDGHSNFFRQAGRLGEYLVVVVAPDAAVMQLKGHEPRMTLVERMRQVEKDNSVDEVVSGDTAQGSWEVVKKHQPSVIALGYDQEAMRQELEKNKEQFGFPVTLVITKAYQPERYSSRLLFPREK